MEKKTKDQIVNALGAKTAKAEKDWKGLKVFVPVFDDFQGYVGYPDFILEDKDGNARLSTWEESLELLRYLYGEEKETKTFSTFKKQ